MTLIERTTKYYAFKNILKIGFADHLILSWFNLFLTQKLSWIHLTILFHTQ